ncbi:aldo/keto reductase [Alkalicoccus daliensis]|uniref:Predicted oxidoreductase n=1 Tax=Alkalicoccus daliensis TaxID=745820 RepID=A0A1G9ZJL2_9BACI|nr:aldo/keto reductase [Alkalicoccus daliensis]SDN21484.1 Predicted oxidoreductase [Alkalicoccus daliensis]
MKKIMLGTSEVEAGEIALGCMRMDQLSVNEAEEVIKTSLDAGIDLFDHADIYGKGKSEEVFGKAVDLRSSIRDQIVLQSKCGIRDGFFDFSKEHIIRSVEGSLTRLGAESLDVLLLHRPDALMEPEEIAAAFSELKQAGKVKHFGVSNLRPGQTELLRSHVEEPLLINQLQLSLMHTPMLDAGFNVNMHNEAAVNREGQLLEYTRRESMTLQAWSPLQHGMIQGPFVGNKDFPEVNKKLNELAEEKGITATAIAIAWILRIPGSMQPVIGSMNKTRIKEIAQASRNTLSRKEWYELYRAAGNDLP